MSARTGKSPVRERVMITQSNGRMLWITLKGGMVFAPDSRPKTYAPPVKVAREQLRVVPVSPPKLPKAPTGVVHYSTQKVKPTMLVRKPDGERRRMYFGDATAQPVSQYNEEPAFAPSLETHVYIPMSVAGAISSCIGGVVGLVTDSFESGVLATLTTFPLVSLWRLGIMDNTIKRIEEFVGVDIDGDGDIGEATAEAPIGKVFVDMPDNSKLIYDCPISHNKARRLLSHLRESEWYFSRTQRGPLSQSEFQHLYQFMNAHELVANNDVTERGRDFIAGLAVSQE